jgi:hypothetical protein
MTHFVATLLLLAVNHPLSSALVFGLILFLLAAFLPAV